MPKGGWKLLKKLKLFNVLTFSVLFTVCFVTTSVAEKSEKIARTIEIQYPSKNIKDSVEVTGVPGCRYTFKVVGTLPEGTHIEWKEQSTTKGSWSNNVLYPYAVGGGSGTYHIKAVLVGGEGPGPGWEVDVDGTITDPVLAYSEPGEDTYFAEGQTTPTPQVDLKVTVTKPGGTKLEGVDVNFVGKREDDSILGIGISSSNSSGEATKPWTVPVGSYRRYTLKAGTGDNYLKLENEIAGKKVYVMRLIAKEPMPSHFRTAEKSKTAAFYAELHDPGGVVTSATEKVTFELTANPRGAKIQSSVSAVNGVATSTYTPPNLTWSERSKPSGNVKTVVTENFRSSFGTEWVYAIPVPGIGIRIVNTNVNGLAVSLWSEQVDRGPPIPLDYVADEFRASSQHGFNTCNVTVDWGDKKVVNYDPEPFVTGIGVRWHEYDPRYEDHKVKIKLTIKGVVRRTLKRTERPPSDDTEWYNYGDTDKKDVQL